MNVENKNELATLSVDVPEWSTTSYSPTMVPKAPDKCARHIDDEQNTEVQIAPRSGEKDHAGTTQARYLYDLLTHTRQWSLCDINHVSRELTCLNITSSILGTMGCDRNVPLAWHIDSVPIYYYDVD